MATLTDNEFAEIVDFVYKRYGIDLKKKKILVESRLSAILRELNVSSFSQYISIIKDPKNSAELQSFLNVITTNHSYFAREVAHFDFLTSTVLPELEKNRFKKEIRIWSAGCSSGQEAYNLAIVFDQYFGARKSEWDTVILATDISTKVLNKAYKGIYTSEEIAGLPADWLSKYFTKLSNDTYQVCSKIRKEVVFRKANLMEPFVYKQPFDIIFCRNVMIYFDQPTIENLVSKFYDATINKGYFFMGHSEAIPQKSNKFTMIKPSIYKKG